MVLTRVSSGAAWLRDWPMAMISSSLYWPCMRSTNHSGNSLAVFKRPVNSDLAAFRPLKAVRSASLMMSLKEAMLTPRPMTKAPNANKRAGALAPNTMCSFCQWRKAAYTVSAISWRSWRPNFLWSLKNFDNTMSAGERNRLTSAIRRSVWMSCGLFI